MKSEVGFIYEFGLYELSAYAKARKRADALKEKRDQVFEELYEDCSPVLTSFDEETGRWYTTSTPVEEMALHIIEKKESYQKMIDLLERKAEMFEIAIETLTPREQDVVNVVYFGAPNNLGLSPEYFHEVLKEAQEKLCSYIGQKQLEKQKEWQRKLKEERKRQVSEWKLQVS
jgi:hypothetical protein